MNRYRAMELGAKWYKAKQPCEQGHLSLRRTRDCKCKECLEWSRDARRKTPKPLPPTKGQKRRERAAGRQRRQLPADQLEMMKAAPDVVIDRGAAISAGWEIYRTGRPCAQGHSAWRFVSGGACTVCGAFD